MGRLMDKGIVISEITQIRLFLENPNPISYITYQPQNVTSFQIAICIIMVYHSSQINAPFIFHFAVADWPLLGHVIVTRHCMKNSRTP